MLETLEKVLEHLVLVFPLLEGWGRPELFYEQVEIHGLRIFLVGLSSLSRANTNGPREVTGSAASIDSWPLNRAYFELLERMSVIEAERAGKVHFKGERLPHWKFSRSNGVALYTNQEIAKQSSACELIERDRILRSWYGDPLNPVQVVPEVGLDSLLKPYESIQSSYHFKLVSFQEKDLTFPGWVYGFFGIPKSPKNPLFFGFGASNEREIAATKAIEEGIQRLGFLWGCEIPSEKPKMDPTALMQQEHFLYPGHLPLVESWLSGAHASYRYMVRASALERSPMNWLDLTPSSLKEKLFVMKAFSKAMVPLTFGIQNPFILDRTPEELLIHPIA